MLRSSALALLLAPTAAVAQLATQLTPSDPDSGLEFGESLAMDGRRVVVGAAEGGIVAQSGNAYVFELHGNSWTEVAKLAPSDPVGLQRFGEAVALEGDKLLVGAIGPKAVMTSGDVYAFELVAGTWIERQKLTPPLGQPGDAFGDGLALDGSNLLVGASGTDVSGTDHGRAFPYENLNGSWSPLPSFAPSDLGFGDRFGREVVLDGDEAVFGVQRHDQAGANAGAAYVFQRQGSAWIETQKIIPADVQVGDRFGSAVALAGDRLFIGANGVDTGSPNAGAVYVFERLATGWSQVDKLVGSDPAGVSFGSGIGYDGGRRVLLGGAGLGLGRAYLFEFLNGAWVEVAALTGNPYSTFGDTVAFDGDHGMVAQFGFQQAGVSSVMAYDFGCIADGVTSYCTGKLSSEGCVPRITCSDGPASTTGSAPFFVGANEVPYQAAGHLIYGIDGRAALPWQGGTLCVSPPLKRTVLQSSGGSPSACGGALSFSFNGWIQSGADPALTSGVRVDAQYWFRDPEASFGVGLSDALEFVIE